MKGRKQFVLLINYCVSITILHLNHNKDTKQFVLRIYLETANNNLVK